MPIKILISLPALNEEKTIGRILEQIKQLAVADAIILPMVIDDGSTDKTAEIGRAADAIVVSHHQNRGVGAAFQSAVNEAINQNVDIMVNIDSDGQFDPADIPKLVAPILTGQADFVTASRFVNDYQIKMPIMKKWGNFQIARLVSWLTKQKIHDASCGFRAYTRKALLNLNLIGDFTYTHEVILTLAFRKLTIYEIPINVRGTREFGQSRVASSLFKYAYRSLLIILRCLRDYKPLLTFGLPGAILAGFGTILLIMFVVWSAIRGMWFPKVAAFASAFCYLFAILFFMLALVSDMFTRLRIKLEKITETIDKLSQKGN